MLKEELCDSIPQPSWESCRMHREPSALWIVRWGEKWNQWFHERSALVGGGAWHGLSPLLLSLCRCDPGRGVVPFSARLLTWGIWKTLCCQAHRTFKSLCLCLFPNPVSHIYLEWVSKYIWGLGVESYKMFFVFFLIFLTERLVTIPPVLYR